MNFIIMFMASPEYIRNPYLRAKMVEVLNCWMPRRRYFILSSFYVLKSDKFLWVQIKFLVLMVLYVLCVQWHIVCYKLTF